MFAGEGGREVGQFLGQSQDFCGGGSGGGDAAAVGVFVGVALFEVDVTEAEIAEEQAVGFGYGHAVDFFH